MNVSLFQDNTFNSLLKEDFKKSFESNAGRTDTKATESFKFLEGELGNWENQELELSKHFSDKLYQDV